MNQAQAKELIHKMVLACVKARSNAVEALGDDPINMSVLRQTEPYLFPEEGDWRDLVKILTVYEEKAVLEQGDLYNAILVFKRSMAAQMALLLIWEIIELPKGINALIMEESDEHLQTPTGTA